MVTTVNKKKASVESAVNTKQEQILTSSYQNIDLETLEPMVIAFTNVRKMLDYRGYDMRKVEYRIESSVLKSRCIEYCGFVMQVHKYDNEKDVLIVIFNIENGISVGSVRDVYKGKMDALGIKHAVIVSYKGPTHFTAKELQKDEYSEYDFEFHTYMEHALCKIEHHLQPKHVVISEQEATEYLKQYKVAKTKRIPQIKQHDALAKMYNVKPGQVMKFFISYGAQEPFIRHRVVM
jgi:DNA-directed RNA polymerase subunit H (RpoH/RPB5)